MYHGKLTPARKKRKYAEGGEATNTTIGAEKKKTVRTMGGRPKTRIITAKFVDVIMKGKYVKCEIITLTENPANKDFMRRNIITKGAILKVKTPEGKEISAKVTSRPGQDGILTAAPLL
jgi:small subunit ribosomal protein S8e